MNESEIHHVKGSINKHKLAQASDISENYLYDDSDKVKKVTTRSKSRTTKSTKSAIKSRTNESNRVIKTQKDGDTDKANIKEAFKSIHTIESDVEHDKVKLAKKKFVAREAELKRKQLPNVPKSKAFRPGDIQRIVQHTTHSIFDKEECALWTGYITNLQNKRKGTYVNFYFRNKKKVALHRLLYANFKGEIGPSEYIKYSCSNKGKCCNVNHMVKFEYNSEAEFEKQEEEIDKKGNKKRNNSKQKQKNKSNRHSITKDDFKIQIY